MKYPHSAHQRMLWLIAFLLSSVMLLAVAFAGTMPVGATRLDQANPTATALQATIFALQTRNAPSPQTIDLTSTAQMATIQALSGTQPPVVSIGPGKLALVTDAGNELYVLASPKPGSLRLAVLLSGDQVTVMDGPQELDGRRWWQVQLLDGHTGWVVEGQNGEIWLTGSTHVLPSASGAMGMSYLFIGARVVNNPSTRQQLAIRDSPGLSGQPLKYLTVAQDVINVEVVLVVGGPQVTDGLRWWKVRFATPDDPTFGHTGWVAEGDGTLHYLKVQYPIDKASNVRGGHLHVGDTIRVTSSGDGLKLRTKPSRTAPAVTTLGQQVNATVLDGPVTNEGHNASTLPAYPSSLPDS